MLTHAHSVCRHLGFFSNASCPWNRGFDSTIGYLGGEEDYWTKTRPPGFDFRINGVPDHADATATSCAFGDMNCARSLPPFASDPAKYSAEIYQQHALDVIRFHATHHADTPMCTRRAAAVAPALVASVV